MKKRTESQLTTACLKYLQVLENAGDILWVDRLNSGSVLVRKGRATYKIQLCRPGTPDIMAILRSGSILWIENKIGKGKLSDEQKDFMSMALKTKNHIHIVVRELGELVEFLKGSF